MLKMIRKWWRKPIQRKADDFCYAALVMAILWALFLTVYHWEM